jgi:hypothetical protein
MSDTHYKLIVLIVCMIGYTCYGLVQGFGTFENKLAAWYTLTPAEAHWLYFALTLGDSGLSFIMGICLDRFGAWRTSLMGLMFGVVPLSINIASYAMDPSHRFMQRHTWMLYLQLVSEGFCASCLDILCSIAPLLVFSNQNAGKVSAALQVSKSLGMAINGAVEAAFFQGDLGVLHRQIYILTLMLLFFLGAAALFWWGQDLIEHSEVSADGNGKQSSGDQNEPPLRPLSCQEIVRMWDFWYIVFTFLVTVGFYYSFLEQEASIADTLGVSSSAISVPFGIINAFTRVSGAVSFDCTRKYRFGGGLTYVVVSQVVFVGGLCLLLLPASPDSQRMYGANVMFAIGFGGTMGLIPPTLRISFGSQHLGKIYGGLFAGVAVSLPFWTALSGDAGSQGFVAYRRYLVGGCIGLSCMAASGLLLVVMLPKFSDSRRSPPSSEQSVCCRLGSGQQGRMSQSIGVACSTDV